MDIRFAYQANCWGPLGGHPVGVTSIGQLTYLTFGDMDRAIAEIAGAGYQGVELFDGNLLDHPGGATALRSSLAGAGVKLVAAYSGANFIFPDVAEQEIAKIARGADAAAPVPPFAVDGRYFSALGAPCASLAGASFGNSGFFSAFDGLAVVGAGAGVGPLAAPETR